MSLLLTPRFSRIGLIGTALGALLYRIAGGVVLPARIGNWSFLFLAGAVVAHVIAVTIAFRLTGEYAEHTRMRTAWLLIALSNLVALFRHVLEFVLLQIGFGSHPCFGLRQFPIVLALILLLKGLLVMSSAFSSAGLAPRLLKRDIAVMIAMLVVLPPALLLERHEQDINSPFALVRVLNLITPFFLAATAGMGVYLYRTATQLGKGQLGRSLQFLALFPAVRLLLSVVTILPDHLRDSEPLAFVLYALVYTPSWFLSLAMAERWELTTEAVRRMKEHVI